MHRPDTRATQVSLSPERTHALASEPSSYRRKARAQRPSAALVLGVVSGVLASATYLPTVVPLTLRVVAAEEVIALRHASAAAASLSRLLDAGTTITDGMLTELGVVAIDIRAQDAPLYTLGMPLSDAVVEPICAAGQAELVPIESGLLAIECLENARHRVVVAHAPTFTTGTNIAYLVLVLAVIVGIITALGVLRLLRPLSQVGKALTRLSAAERGVHIATTGLAELDDLVERVNAAARAIEHREDAIKARIQVVQEMARLVAHEVRNPLQSLELLTSLIATEEDSKERQELARSIHTEIRALDMVVGRLLREGAASGALRLHKTVQPVAPMVEQVVSLRRPEANTRGIRLTLGLMSWRPVPVDATLFGRSIENLVLNAMQAVSSGNGEVRVSLYEEDPWLCFAVDDNGPGVDPALVDAIFEPNVTTKAGGTGLGLTLVRGVVEAHRGYITCGPSALGGARFVARIPYEDRGGDEHVGEPKEAADPGRR